MNKRVLVGMTALLLSLSLLMEMCIRDRRMIARGASIDVDGGYSNPAGLAFLPQNGLQVALTIQSAYPVSYTHLSFADFEVNTSVIGSEANTFSKEKHTSIWALRNPMSIDCWKMCIRDRY